MVGIQRTPTHPATGAWMPGHAVGSRRFHTLDRPLALDGAVTLEGVVVAYETWGALNAARDNEIGRAHV